MSAQRQMEQSTGAASSVWETLSVTVLKGVQQGDLQHERGADVLLKPNRANDA